MVISNERLLNCAFGIVRTLTDRSEAVPIEAVHLAGNDNKTAVLNALGQSPKAARATLRQHHSIWRDCIAALEGGCR